MRLQSGQVLSSTLRLVKKIADGGMGSVWLAEHLVLGTEVAVKCMAPPFAEIPAACARFVREARMTAKIESPHVVRVLDCRMTESDEPYLVLELLHGVNLLEKIENDGPLSLRDCVEVIDQSCEALVATHATQIVHRDLKPENVFLVECGNLFVKLLDFGVARPRALEACAEDDKLTAGTPQFMSPEHMFDPEMTDERSDLFSLASVAYFALTGQPPFSADTIEGLWFAIEGGQFERPSALRSDLPAAVDRFFEKALAREPENRFQDARQLARAFRDAAFPERDTLPEIEIAPISVMPRRTRNRRRFAVAVAAIAAATAFAWHNAETADAAAAQPMTGAEQDATVDGKL